MPVRPRRTWTKDLVLDAIRRSYAQGTLRTRWREERSLIRAAVERFGSWQAAIEAAGLPKYVRSWIKRSTIEAIRALQREGVPLDRIWKEDPTLYHTAKRYFGTWRNALLAAGLPCHRQTWSRRRVLDEIQDRRRRGESVAEMRSWNALAAAAKLYFGTWGAALLAAGVPYTRPRRWTKHMVLEQIRDRHQRGLPLVSSCREVRPLSQAGNRLFGSWNLALVAAGVPTNHRQWSKERVIQEIQHHYGHNLGTPCRDDALKAAATRLFGSWTNAKSAAGALSARERSRQRIIQAIQDRYVKGEPVESLREDPKLALAAKRAFGSWGKALLAAGLREAK